MSINLDREIRTLDDVKSFLKDLIGILGFEFHIEVDCEIYEDENGKPLFDQNQRDQIDTLLMDCCEVCQDSDVDVYKLSFETTLEYYQRLEN